IRDPGGRDAAVAPADAGGGTDDAGGAGGAGCKRGVAMNAAPTMAFAPSSSSPGIHWWYNYAAKGQGAAPGIEFVPMIWGTGTNGPVPAGARFLLGYNE